MNPHHEEIRSLAAGAEIVPNGKSECERILAALMPMIEKSLRSDGRFYPVGGFIQPDGKVAIAAAPGDPARPIAPAQSIDMLRGAFVKMADSGSCSATAIFHDARITFPETGKVTDAVQASLEHSDGFCATVIYPYKKSWGRLKFGEAFRQHAEPQIFRTRQ